MTFSESRAWSRITRSHAAKRSRPPHGVTLLETLATVVLISIVAGSLAVGFSVVSESSNRFSKVSLLRQLDVRARVFAQLSGPLVLQLTANGTVVSLRDQKSRRPLRTLELEPGRLQLFAPNPVREIVFDQTGLSPDYTVVLEDNGNVTSWAVSGTSGWHSSEEEL